MKTSSKNAGKIYSIEGIVLKRRNFSESDKIVTIYTKEAGKIQTLAKGVRKVPSRRAGHLEVFTQGIFTLYRGKTFDYVQEVSSKMSFVTREDTLQKVSYFFYLTELLDRILPDDDASADIYDLFMQSMHHLYICKQEDAYQGVVYSFALELLWALGYLPKTYTISADKITEHIESIIERRLQTVKLLEAI